MRGRGGLPVIVMLAPGYEPDGQDGEERALSSVSAGEGEPASRLPELREKLLSR